MLSINTSVEDLKSTLQCCRGKFSLTELNNCLAEEWKSTTKRVTVIRMLQREVKLVWKTLTGEELFKNYPKVEINPREIRHLYVRYPALIDDKWYAVNVCLPTGYEKLPTAIGFDDKRECRKRCDAENVLVGFTPKQAHEIIDKSLENSYA